MSLGQDITGSGSLVQAGPGNTTLSGDCNTYSGGTTISNGTLLATNPSPTSSATGSGSVAFENSARLAGTGRITGDVTFQTGAKLVIGDLFGGLLSSTGAFEARLDLFSHLGNGTLNSSLSADQLVISGTDRLIDLDIQLVLGNPNSLLNWAVGDSWHLWTWGGISLGNRQITLSSLSAPTLPGDLFWDTSQSTPPATSSPPPSQNPRGPFCSSSASWRCSSAAADFDPFSRIEGNGGFLPAILLPTPSKMMSSAAPFHHARNRHASHSLPRPPRSRP